MKINKTTCYRCSAVATTREHIPPKSFFPRGGNLQLKTVPSCTTHNNEKSGDDQYLLSHICMNAALNNNLASQIFFRSIAPQLDRSKKFKDTLIRGSQSLPSGARNYTVDLVRFDNFFDHLVCAIYFDRYQTSFNPTQFEISHYYLSLTTQEPAELQRRAWLTSMLGDFFSNYQNLVEHYEADKIKEVVYQHKIIDPLSNNASITIAHTFYGVFEVVTLLTRKWANSKS